MVRIEDVPAEKLKPLPPDKGLELAKEQENQKSRNNEVMRKNLSMTQKLPPVGDARAGEREDIDFSTEKKNHTRSKKSRLIIYGSATRDDPRPQAHPGGIARR